ncbi:MBL fold metallo-hydrolase [Thiohalophilus sp.]|uniref:MBL fold metallo-hydrolase n=1 Tax=Thiohalophilus sp. TaxID=3028392 RepID=UPI002ACDABBD|nr:MBL fold metallo-hydrolase [Thiohalophilus sp.]MDZ7662643.1 MBL fold metallo-hydrolase [Thiohalophilus sp.]
MRQLTGVLFLMGCLAGTAGAEMLQGELANPESVVPTWNFPKNVIDTRQLPRFSLQSENDADTPLPVYQLTRHTYFLFGTISTLNEDNRGWNGNAGFVVTDEGVVVIDTLGTPRLGQRLIATVRSVTDKPIRYLIITHNHPDHAYGAAAFQSLDAVTIIAHPGTREYNNSSTLEESVAYRREQLAEDMQGFSPPEADQYIEQSRFDKKVIELGEQRFEIYNTGRHHSYGDLVIYQPAEELVWISDLAFNQRTTYMGDGDSEQILEGQKWLKDNFANARLMIPGHGGPQTEPFPMVNKTRDYVQRLRREMREAVEQGVSLQDAVNNSHFDDWEGTRLYEENHRANVNYIYREMEREFFE